MRDLDGEVSKSTKEIVDLTCLTAPIALHRLAYFSGVGTDETKSALFCEFFTVGECQYWRFTLAMLRKLQITEFKVTGNRRDIAVRLQSKD
ncbi:hypothetical protein PRIPAC_70782 [Pristionchus pacificus]|uniref:Uncharacterized protein n=1 Tax=Pristionchus pacificus TaxID=54126 RepID=A0A2A6C0P2_PRIPA|nr:hypothetical protein PRIPAC_70782 [Pristionchus pacificus]|eukprot:PDM71676.1 hypothetical protein PRIPAC_38083 [Pristionchus pacificus]